MGRYTLFIVLAAVVGGGYLTVNGLFFETETAGRRSAAQAQVLARQLAESGQAVALATITGHGGFEEAPGDDAGLFRTERPYDGGRITFEDYTETSLGAGAERVEITVAGAYGGATHRLNSVYEFDPMDFPGPIWLDVPHAAANIHASATISGGGMGYEPQIDPTKFDALGMDRLGLSLAPARNAFAAAGTPIPDWSASGA